jgi:hypothetical protein
MKNFIIYLAIALCVFCSKLQAQETNNNFENRAKIIAESIENITKSEKAKLKASIENVNSELQNGTINKQQADDKKLDLATKTASEIEKLVAIEQEKLNQLVQEKVDGKIAEVSKTKRIYSWSFQGMFKDTIRKSERRTTNQFVFAMGLNNVMTNNALSNSDFRYFGSHFYEWGITNNTRIIKDSNLLHAKYGFSVMYNNLRPTDNRSFVVSGNQTTLQTNSINTDDSRFKNVYLVFPLHLEFDFTKTKIKDGKTIFNSHEGFRFGIGGYAGINLKSKQYLEFNSNSYETSIETQGDFNTNNFIYGLSSYIGLGETSLYVKYDLNPLFKDNVVKQNNISLGVRWDFN